MSKRLGGTIVAALLLLGGSAAGQQKPAPTAVGRDPGGPQSPKPAQAVAAREAPGQPLNIKLDLTITDQAGPGEPAKRTVTMIVADRQSGSIRSTGNQVQARMFVDATPRILPNGNVQVSLGLEYNPRQTTADKPENPGTVVIPQGTPLTGGSSLNQRITLILEPNKPLVISQAADPVTDRKITVEVRAAILK
jgi:hypothetical protein